jgi:large subunit ribosomal protein L29
MKAPEIRELTVDDLRAREKELDDQLFRLRIQKSMGQLEAPAKIRDLRRDLARIKTILREKQQPVEK